MKPPPRVAIIGAGIAGLSCATQLARHGCAVSVFDKSRGPAGRMSTRRGEGWQCDHGAQYFTARSPEFRAEVARWQAAGAAAPWPARLAVLGEPPGSRLPDAALQRFVGTPRMTAPARLLAAGLPLALQTTITAITPEPAGWRLDAAEHGPIAQRFDRVVLAVPAPQAVPLVQPVAAGLAAVAAGARMRACWALMLRYAEPLALPFDAAFVNSGPLRWVARDSSKPGRHAPDTWLLHAGAAWSEARLEQAPEAVAEALLEAFAAFGARTPDSWSAHRWRYADTEPAIDRGHVLDAPLGIGLCGDWLNGGKVEGAWLSGRALAEAILAAP